MYLKFLIIKIKKSLAIFYSIINCIISIFLNIYIIAY